MFTPRSSTAKSPSALHYSHSFMNERPDRPHLLQIPPSRAVEKRGPGGRADFFTTSGRDLSMAAQFVWELVSGILGDVSLVR
jgi:hypothetical protein